MTIGFIGTGNMGGALARAVAAAGTGDTLLLSNRTEAKAAALAKELGGAVSDNKTIAERADYIFLGVKPQTLGEVLGEIGGLLSFRADRFVLVSMAAGVSIRSLRQQGARDCPVIRIMPNTPVSVGEGVILYALSEDVTDAEEAVLLSLLDKAGCLSKIPESLIDAGSALAGCGPAFVDLFIEALADGAVACGLPRREAVEYAARMTAGAAKLILETKEHPAALKDAVCSPGGSTIAGVRALERAGFRAAAMEAVAAAYARTIELGKQ